MNVSKGRKEIESEVKNYIEKIGLDSLERKEEHNSSDLSLEKKESTNFKKSQARKNKPQNKTGIKEKGNVKPLNKQRIHHTGVNKSHLLVKPGAIWFEKTNDLECEKNDLPSQEIVKKVMKEAENIYQNEIANYKKYLLGRKDRSDFHFAQTVLKSGTLADKMAAHSMLVQDSALHTLSSIDMLCSMVDTKAKRECLLAIDSLKELFLYNLLTEHRKLKPFSAHPLGKLDQLSSGNRESRQRLLLMWFFEDLLKKKYIHFLNALNAVAHDSIEKTKEKAISVMADLLNQNPEQEQFLLSNLVNKMGDPSNKISGKVIRSLNYLVDSHPNMKMVVVEEVERLLFRPNITSRTQYYCLCFLNQLILGQQDNQLASHLIKVYFSFFNACVKKGEVDSKMMSALLIGTTRAFPYSNTNSETSMTHVNTLFKVVHTVSFNVSIQALLLIFQALNTNEGGPSDRFYCALYKILMEPELANSPRQSFFLNLLFRAMKIDSVDRRVKAFIKRLLQICYYLPSGLVCGILFLISEIIKLRPSLLQFYTLASENQDILDDRSSDDDEEHYKDISDDEDSSPKQKLSSPMKPTGSSWVHFKAQKRESKNAYDPYHRNPLYCLSEGSTMHEYSLLHHHFHPSVEMFLNSHLEEEKLEYPGNPLQDFTLIHFLDRFVFRNPKKISDKMNEDLHNRVFGRRKLYQAKGARSLSISSDGFLGRREEKVPAEDLFLYKYLKQQSVKTAKKAEKEDNYDDDDLESVASCDFEALLDKMEPESWVALDFAEGVSQKKKEKPLDSEEEGEDDDLLNEDIAEDEDFKNAFDEYDQDLKDLPDIDDEEMDNAEVLDEEDFGKDYCDEEETFGRKRKLKYDEKKWKKPKSNEYDTSEMFASAEEFSHLLEENAGNNPSSITTQALANRDKADAKQLKWETSRDQWIRGAHWKNKNKGSNKVHNKKKGAKVQIRKKK